MVLFPIVPARNFFSLATLKQFGGRALRTPVIVVFADSWGSAVVDLSPDNTAAIPSAMAALDGNSDTVTLPGIAVSMMTDSVGTGKRAAGAPLMAGA